MEDLQSIEARRNIWQRDLLNPKEIAEALTSWGHELEVVYTPEHSEHGSYLEDIGFPGEFPFVRGVYPSMYRGRLWTMRLYAGYGTAEETNAHFKYLLSQGNTGLSVAFDLPTQTGLDSDSPMAKHEVGRVGVAVDTLKDMEIIFDGISLDKITCSFTINPMAPVILAMYIAVAEKQGIDPRKIGGTLQNDILKEYMARGTQIFPLKPSLRLVGDIMEYCRDYVPRMNTISICGYHMREAGCGIIQEVAYLLLNARAYVELALARGLNIDEFAPRLSFLMGCGQNLFEEVAKFRAARRMWAKTVRDRFKAKKPESMKMRIFSGCFASNLTAHEPLNNIVRATIMNLVAVLSGNNAVHTTAYDEAYDIPSKEAALLALRTQQIIAYETDVASVADPMGGAYLLEYLTNRIEKDVENEMARIEKKGGVLAMIEDGSIQREIADQAYESEKKIQNGEKVIIGLNKYRSKNQDAEMNGYKPREDIMDRQLERLRKIKMERDSEQVNRTLLELRKAAEGEGNMIGPMLKAVRQYATVGEICGTLRPVFGEFKETV